MRNLTFFCAVVAGTVLPITCVAESNTKSHLQSQNRSKTQPKNNSGYDPSVPEPTHKGIRYGAHPINNIDFWLASSEKPTPLVMVIHGGGWKGGSSKEKLHRLIDTAALVEAGISVASINYRLLRHAEGVVPPVKAPLEDAARALQFIRKNADQWNIDKTKIGLSGGSAGGCSSLWLGYNDDFADPDSEDPVARESTRVACLALNRPQSTLDPKQMQEWISNSEYGAHAFGLESFEQYLADRESILPWIEKYSPYEHLSAGDPPTYLWFSIAPRYGKPEKDPTHSALFGTKLKERCDELGVECEVVYPGAPDVKHETITDYLIAFFKAN